MSGAATGARLRPSRPAIMSCMITRDAMNRLWTNGQNLHGKEGTR